MTRRKTFKRGIWTEVSGNFIPEFFTDSSLQDKGLRIADLNNDGFADLIQGRDAVRKAWLFNGTNWNLSTTWAPPIDFVDSLGYDFGTQLADLNGDGRVDLIRSRSGTAKLAYLNTGKGWIDASSQWIAPSYFVDSVGTDLGARLVDINGDGLVDFIKAYNIGSGDIKAAWLNNGSGWVNSTAYTPPYIFTSDNIKDTGLRTVDVNGDGLADMLADYKNGSITNEEAWINTGNGWANSSSWASPEPFTLNGRNIGTRIGDVNGDGFGDIIIASVDPVAVKRVVVRNTTVLYLLKNITNEFGGVAYLEYSSSTSFNNTGDDGISDLGFNVWVVKQATQNNSLNGDFGVFSNTSYVYYGGVYDINDSEFRGFNIVNETLSDKSLISHYFYQTKQLKGKEFKTETYDSSKNIFSKTENNFNYY